ncbi:hypothetical protein QR680_004726 [Steinernema hermaphroditum]|uniref:Uncharacterized protein n=1 Tax=Steinernema hermaphroditum TaxID=289476 RepID=A0AA39HQQ2_9BILA|nr:hypothetical protein QR680_004726 [Steinernema hermaphroditum]
MNASWSCGNVSHWIHKDYFQNQGLVIGIVLLVMYVCFMVPQVIVFFSLVFSEPRMLKYSCHRIMIVICVLDMVNLSYALLSTGIYAVTQHLLCTESVYDLANLINQGLTFWYAYSAANIALALNRSLQILNKNYSKQLFDGYRLVLWIIAIAAYAVILHFSASDPIYFFNKQEVISLIMVRRGAKILVNPIHYYNNIAKSIIISLNSFIIFVYIRKEAAQASRSSITTMERNVSIQVVIMTIITDISVISYVITDWEGNPIKSWIFYGTMIQVSWGLLHGLNAIIYLTLNRSVRNSAKQMLSNAVRGRRSPSDAVNSRPERKSSLSQAANQSVVK